MQHVMCEYSRPALFLLRSHRFSDGAFGRVMATELPDNQNLTVESCVNSCNSQNFTLAGLEFAGTTV